MEPLSMNVVLVDGAFHWMLALFGAFTVLTLAWLVAAPYLKGFGWQKVSCPSKGRSAYVVFRKPSQGPRELLACSLGGRARRLTCHGECLGGGRRGTGPELRAA